MRLLLSVIVAFTLATTSTPTQASGPHIGTALVCVKKKHHVVCCEYGPKGHKRNCHRR